MKKEFKGQLKGFPEEVVEKMLEYQVLQGNKKDVTVFERNIYTCKKEGGVNWDIIGIGNKERRIWDRAICYNDFRLFFDRYPKKKQSRLEWENKESPLDNITTDLLRLTFRGVGIDLSKEFADKMIDMFELLLAKGDQTTIKDLELLKSEWDKTA